MNKPKIEHPKVFISYAWTSDVYVNKVAAFACSLIDVGIDVLFDKFEMKPGNELNDFMERSVKDPSVTNVLLLLNKTYQEKADNRQGGVGKEAQILSEELYNHVNQTKIIPVVFEKGPDGKIYKPAYLGSTFYIDLADPDRYDSEFQLLVKSIYGETVYRKPKLGKTPSWVTDVITFDAKVSVEFSSLKNQSDAEVKDYYFISYLDRIKDKILTYRTDDLKQTGKDDFYQQYLDKYNGLIPVRNEYLELLKYSVYISAPEKNIATFFEKTLSGILSIKGYRELQEILLDELFIYTVSYFLRIEKYDKIAYLLGKTYCINHYSTKLCTYGAFYCTNSINFNEAVRFTDGKNYLTGVGNYWINNINADFCSKSDFVLADILCFNYALFGAKSGLYIYWFPITYVYEEEPSPSGYNSLKIFAEKLKTKEFLKEAVILFNYDSVNSFASRYKEVEFGYAQGKFKDFRYIGAFYSAPILCQYVKSDELGKYR